jgi:hypothetical protein
MKPIVFISSSTADTDFFFRAAERLAALGQPCCLVPTTAVAAGRLKQKSIVSELLAIISGEELHIPTEKKVMTQAECAAVVEAITKLDPMRVVVDTSSYLNEAKVSQIGLAFSSNEGCVPTTVFNGHLFNLSPQHCFHTFKAGLAAAPSVDFVFPLPGATGDLPKEKVVCVGHPSLDAKAPGAGGPDLGAETRQLLKIEGDKFALISGSTQPMQVDCEFLKMILSELAKPENADMQVRFSIHPGSPLMPRYIEALLQVCDEYPDLSDRFKIILNPVIIAKLEGDAILAELRDSPFMLEADVSGPAATAAASHIAQAVPGGLVIEAAQEGKVVTSGVLPHKPLVDWFHTPQSFFGGERSARRDLRELGFDTDQTSVGRFVDCLSV